MANDLSLKDIHSILIFDYDGTLTLDDAKIPPVTVEALTEVRDEKLATLGIISGRDLQFLKRINSEISNVFSFLVAENGAISYFYSPEKTVVLGADWTERAREVFSHSDVPVKFAEIICATHRDYAPKVSEILSRARLDSKLVPNRDSLMILPPNVDKGTGVASAVEFFGTTRKIHLTCFGDGENDLALFAPADLGVAVSNSVDQLKKIADVVTENPGGLGVAEYLDETFLIERSPEKKRS